MSYRAFWRWTPLLLLSGAIFVESLLASEVSADRQKRQAKPFDDELPPIGSAQSERLPYSRRFDASRVSHDQRRQPRVHELQAQSSRPDPSRQESRPDPSRHESRPDPSRHESRPDPSRHESRPDPSRQDPYYELRQDPRQHTRYDARFHERTSTTRRPQSARYDPRLENRRRIYTEFDDLGEEKGNWSEWITNAPCSRSCGGGVTFKQRTCLEGNCIGPPRIYSTCNKHDCPQNETQEDFLLKQCQRLNSIPVDGRYSNWIVRRRHDRNPCELSCSPRERDYELKFRQNVIDGTRCYHAGFDQCVEGQCVATGCDGLLGSKKRIDKCLVCGGENKNCNTTILTESRDQLPSGYVPLVVIPKGATSIMVRESKVTHNYISLKDLNNVWYINKDYEIDDSKAFLAGNAKFHYTRNPQYLGGREFLRADGPTNETLIVMLLVQQMNEGFEIEFSLKEIPGQPRLRSEEFQWEKGEWQPCVDPCGERNTSRTVRCASIITNLDATDVAECDAAERPASEKTCPVDSCQSDWYTGNWERCSNTCGNGTQTRVVFCSTAAGEGVRVLPDRLCKEKGEKPSGEQECISNESCNWEVGDWSESEKKCGVTKQFREVSCIRQLENSTEGVELDVADCLEDLKPASEREVLLEPCNDVEWATSEFLPCTECGSTIQTRKVECVNDEGHVYDDSHCAAKPKPEKERPCDQVPLCQYRWFTSEWSVCSERCGPGVQTRSVFCAEFDLNSTCASAVEESNCKAEKPSEKQLCEAKPCGHVWLSAPWNKQCPENTCGGIPRKRHVFCYKDGKLATDDCPEDEKPKDTEVCSPQACAGDAIDVLGGCVTTEHGCCPDGVTSAGSSFEGCPAIDRENITTPCDKTEWGCCRDLVTPAFGPFDAGCSLFALCNGTEYGCCPDGKTTAKGSNFTECEASCESTAFGCCPDRTTAALDDQLTGCETETTTVEALEVDVLTAGNAPFDFEDAGSGGSGDVEGSGDEPIEVATCEGTEHGCCPDNVTPAKDAEKRRGCVHCRVSKFGCCPDQVTAALGRNFKGCADACTNSTFGCCPDGFFPAKGPAFEGCKPVDCKNSKFGCCGKLKIPALGAEKQGCKNCTESVYGCCANNEDFALGPSGEGCCADSPFGCCSDNKTIAQGPNLAGCPCSLLPFGCCPDKITPALGPKLYGCTCETSEFGCCSDLITPALGPGQANCTCDRTAFGCCPDGISVALGPDTQKSCDCRSSTFSCCPDGRTPATGPSQKGCHCSTMKYGCCPDNQTPAAGPHFAGCPCQATHYGCCLDGFTRKLGPRNEGCEDCTKLKFGCCPDGDHAARGADFQGCPCDATEFGCCPDRVTAAKGAGNEGCPEVPCNLTQFGCCPDKTAAKGRDYEGCNLTDDERRRYEEHRRSMEARRRYPGDHTHTTRPPYYEPRRVREACFQNEDRGPCSNWTLAFFYNSHNNTCSMFYYGGCGGNDNRFSSKESCSSLCQSTGATSPEVEYIQPVDVNEVISPTRRTERYPCDLAKDPGTCTGHLERFWYNENLNRCERFIYGGCQGNENRFINHKACTERCKVLSDKEKCVLPAVTSKNCSDPHTLFRFNYKLAICEPYKGCTEDTNVFRDYNSCVKTCQDIGPTQEIKQLVCSLPKDSGPCADFTPMWTFTSGRCTPFYYGGCEGNANRFATEEECESVCEPSSRTVYPVSVGSNATLQPRTSSSVHVCEQPREVGPCQNFEQRYHFDPATRMCYTFNYGGCGGNLNNFISLEDCQRRCMYRNGAFAPQQPRSSSFNVLDCQAPKDRGTCSGNSIMFYYNPSDGVCREFTYSGCGGNLNRFTTRSECDRSCKNAQSRCKLPTIKGRCGGAYRMWTYDAQKDICKQFDYGGCQGNANRFDSKAECEKSCVSGTMEVSGISNDFPEKCRLKADSGGCAHNLHKFYFDLRLGRCLSFLWGGCEGNDNRFETFNDCQKACTIPAMRANLISSNRENTLENYDVPLEKNQICIQPPKASNRNCTDAQESIRFYYDASSEQCLQFVYTGCDGNKNNFVTVEKCRSFCHGVRASRADPPPPDFQPRTPAAAPAPAPAGTAAAAAAAAGQCPPDKCGTLACRIGERREILANNCVRCVCKHPCDVIRCASGEKCAVAISARNYVGVCRPSNKPGTCPAQSCVEAERSSNLCSDDSSCSGLQKCCNNGCNLACVEPAVEDLHITEVVASEGHNAQLDCPLEVNDSVQWTKDGKDVEGSRFDQASGILTISNIVNSDAGVYECTSMDAMDPMPGKVALRIAASPKIIKENPIVETKVAAAAANLSCTVIDGYPRPTVVWSKNDTPLPARSSKYRHLPQNTLQVLDVQMSDQDLYLCTASNEVGKAKFMVALIIPVQNNKEHQNKGQEIAQMARNDALNP